jgi:hypothetical protein
MYDLGIFDASNFAGFSRHVADAAACRIARTTVQFLGLRKVFERFSKGPRKATHESSTP